MTLAANVPDLLTAVSVAGALFFLLSAGLQRSLERRAADAAQRASVTDTRLRAEAEASIVHEYLRPVTAVPLTQYALSPSERERVQTALRSAGLLRGANEGRSNSETDEDR